MSDKSEACPVCGASVVEDAIQKEDIVVGSDSNRQESIPSDTKSKHRNRLLVIGIVSIAFMAIAITTTTIIIRNHKEKQAEEQLRIKHQMDTERVKLEEAKRIEEERKRLKEQQNQYKQQLGIAVDFSNVTYYEYSIQNDNIRFSILYPSFLIKQSESVDKCEFSYGKDYSLIVYTKNCSGKSKADILKESTKKTDTYTYSKDEDWFVLSGINEQGNIYYQRTTLYWGYEFAFVFVYPKSEKENCDAILNKIVKSIVMLITNKHV